MKLYFIAILPNTDVRQRIRTIKEELKEKFNLKHALKLPAHITMQIPFRFPEEEEERLVHSLESFAGRETGFPVQLSGFGSFPPRVIFIQVSNPERVKQLHDGLQNSMKEVIGVQGQKNDKSFHPHVTVASRDLNRNSFEKVWTEFQKRHFEASFQVDSLVLFKHNGKSWDVLDEFFLN